MRPRNLDHRPAPTSPGRRRMPHRDGGRGRPRPRPLVGEPCDGPPPRHRARVDAPGRPRETEASGTVRCRQREGNEVNTNGYQDDSRLRLGPAAAHGRDPRGGQRPGMGAAGTSGSRSPTSTYGRYRPYASGSGVRRPRDRAAHARSTGSASGSSPPPPSSPPPSPASRSGSPSRRSAPTSSASAPSPRTSGMPGRCWSTRSRSWPRCSCSGWPWPAPRSGRCGTPTTPGR